MSGHMTDSARYVSLACAEAGERVFQFTTILISLITKDYETESIEKTYDSRRVPKAAGRGGAW